MGTDLSHAAPRPRAVLQPVLDLFDFHGVHGVIDALTLVAVTAAGLLCPWGVGHYYRALLVCFLGIGGPVLLGAGVVTWLSERAPVRIQGPRRRAALVLRGVRETAVAAWVGACFAAWALSRSYAGLPTGLTWSLPSIGWALTLLQTVAGVVVLDAWLYWKHRILHTRLLFGFHRAHHVYRDPTAFSGFAVGPVESVMTFWPTALVAIPQAMHYGPFYFPVIGGFILLNFYLHCGVTVALLERLLPPLLVNTSAHHNVHHANADTHFGEAFTVWDHLCHTRLADLEAQRESAAAR